MPWAHLMAVMLQYQTYSAAFGDVFECLQTRNIAISDHFDSYWKRDMTEFRNGPTLHHWESFGIPIVACEDVKVSYREDEWERVVPVEGPRLSKYSLSSTLHDQAFLLVESFGQGALAKWDKYLSTAIYYIRAQRFPEVTGSVTIENRSVLSHRSASASRAVLLRSISLPNLPPLCVTGPRP